MIPTEIFMTGAIMGFFFGMIFIEIIRKKGG